MARNVALQVERGAVPGFVCVYDPTGKLANVPGYPSEAPGGVGRVWHGSAVEWRDIYPGRHYFTLRVKDVTREVDSLLLQGLRVVWLEARGQIKAFHPATCIQTVRGVAEALAYQGCLF